MRDFEASERSLGLQGFTSPGPGWRGRLGVLFLSGGAFDGLRAGQRVLCTFSFSMVCRALGVRPFALRYVVNDVTGGKVKGTFNRQAVLLACADIIGWVKLG